jgi:hypothetical protein
MAQLKQHKNATTTPAIRKWIQENQHLSITEVMRQKGLSRNTVVRWRTRKDVTDRSSARHKQECGFTEWQESLIVEIYPTHMKKLTSFMCV